MATWRGEQDGISGTFLDSPFCPRFFPDTDEGRKGLSDQIDHEIKLALAAGMLLLAAIVAALGVLLWVAVWT